MLDQEGAAGLFGGEVENANRRTDFHAWQAGGEQGADQRTRDERTAQLLEDEHGITELEPEAAFAFGQQQPENPELGKGVPQRRIEARTARGELTEPLARERICADLADPGAQRLLILGRQEIHRRDSVIARAAGRGPARR